MSDADGFCVICKETKDPLVTVTEREFKGLLKFSTEREDESVTKYLNGKLENNQITSVQIHEKCRKWYNNRKRMETNKNRLEKKGQLEDRLMKNLTGKKTVAFVVMFAT